MINLGTFKKAMILTFEPGGEEASVKLLNIWLEPQKILFKMRQAGAGGLTSLGSCNFPSNFFPLHRPYDVRARLLGLGP